MFIATIFIIVKIWKQSKCPSVDEWIKKMCVCVHTYTYTQCNIVQPLKKKGHSATCDNMDEPGGRYAT